MAQAQSLFESDPTTNTHQRQHFFGHFFHHTGIARLADYSPMLPPLRFADHHRTIAC